MSVTPQLRLKSGRERSVLRRHPWIFSGAVEDIVGSPHTGDTVQVRAMDGRFLAWAAYSPASQIRARAWSFEEAHVPGPELFDERVEAALSRRRAEIAAEAGNALRLVHGGSYGLPRLVADRYRDTLVVQFFAPGCEKWRAALSWSPPERSGWSRVHER